MSDETEKMMFKFEVWLSGNDIDWYCLEKGEDEFSCSYYVEENTRRAFFTFTGGYAMAAIHHEQTKPVA